MGWAFVFWGDFVLLFSEVGQNQGDVAHLVERSIRIAEVVGSSPIVSTN